MTAVEATLDYNELVARLDVEHADTLAEQTRLLLQRRTELLRDVRAGEAAFRRGRGSDLLQELQDVRVDDVRLIEAALAFAGVEIPVNEEED